MPAVVASISYSQAVRQARKNINQQQTHLSQAAAPPQTPPDASPASANGLRFGGPELAGYRV
jgi:type IV secretory pathway VirB9-like protein